MADACRVAGPRPPLTVPAACELVEGCAARAVILVEGWSDQAALETLARRRRRDLRGEGVLVLPTGGVTNIDRFVGALGPAGLGLTLAGLCDGADVDVVRRCLERLRPGCRLSREGMASLGFFTCEPDLEDELIGALGVAGVEHILHAEGDLDSFRRFQAQPAQRGRDQRAQLHRFMGTRAGRKIRYGSRLVEALPLDRVPPALDRVLDRVQDRVQEHVAASCGAPEADDPNAPG